MSIRLIIQSTIKEGMADAWKEVSAKMTAAARAEEGTTTYGWHLTDDGQVINDDVYVDEAALFAHIGAATEAGLVDGWLATTEISSVAVLGSVSDEGKEGLAAFGAVYYSMVEGF